MVDIKCLQTVLVSFIVLFLSLFPALILIYFCYFLFIQVALFEANLNLLQIDPNKKSYLSGASEKPNC